MSVSGGPPGGYQPSGDLAVVIAALNEADRIGATVAAAAALPGADIVVVVDDGSADGTSAAAAAEGATVIRHARNRGKAAAMETGAEVAALIETQLILAQSQPAYSAPAQSQQAQSQQAQSQQAQSQQAQSQQAQPQQAQPQQAQSADAQPPGRPARSPVSAAPMGTGACERRTHGVPAVPSAAQPHARRHLLFLDGDLAGTAARAGPLAGPIRAGTADMTIAVLTDRVRRGGLGLVVALSGAGIERATGWRPAQPLNGQRCLTRAAFQAALPLAPGFGVETGLTIDLLRAGWRIIEVEVPLSHRATGNDWHAQLHRGRQFADVARALARRRVLPLADPRFRPGRSG